MNALGFILVWAVVLAVVVFLATRASRSQDKPTRFSRAPRSARLGLALALLAVGIGVPTLMLSAADDQVVGGSGKFSQAISETLREGRLEFRRTCASCHTLTPASARGVTGPSLDATVYNKGIVLDKIEKGGGEGESGTMPAGLLTGQDAEEVATYIEATSGQTSP